MARYTGSVCRLCRREGMKLYLKGDRCYTDKCAITRRATPPGQHTHSRRKVSEYGLQLREKQKARRTYGILESQFEKYFDMAERMRGVTGENLLQLLERRLDNVIFRLGFAGSRPEARQMVRHGHILVDGKKVNIPSFLVTVGNVITLKEKSRSVDKFKDNIEQSSKAMPKWLEASPESYEGRIVALPERDDIDMPIEEHLIVELYSK